MCKADSRLGVECWRLMRSWLEDRMFPSVWNWPSWTNQMCQPPKKLRAADSECRWVIRRARTLWTIMWY